MAWRKKLDINSRGATMIEVDRSVEIKPAPRLSETTSNLRLNINRLAYSVKDFQEEFEVSPPKKPNIKDKCLQSLKDSCFCSPTNFFKRRIPILDWLPNYNLEKHLIADIIVGITIAVFQAPQCMGYALIAHVPPIHGLYSAFFPTLVYAFLGTAYHSAIGGEIMMSGVMTGNIVLQVFQENGMSLMDIEKSSSRNNLSHYGTSTEDPFATTMLDAGDGHPIPNLKPAEIASAIGFITGIVFLLMHGLRLGFISIFLSEQFLSGCITAASVHAFASHLRYLFGVHLPYRSGVLTVIYTFLDLFKQWREINVYCVLISCIAITILATSKAYVNPWLLKFRYGVNFPIELIAVIIGTVLSKHFNFNQVYHVPVVGPLPAGIPTPHIPRLSVMQAIGMRVVPCMVYGFTITLTIGKLYGDKHGYEVDPNQELLALGASNIAGSVFTSISAAASVPRAATQEAAGGKTQIVSFVNCFIILFLIIYFGPMLADLPNCVLSSIMAIALSTLLTKVKQFFIYWKASKVDGCVWLFTFVAIIVFDMELGLYLSLAWSLLTLIYKSSRPKTYLLGSINKSDVYAPLNKFMDAKEFPGIKIYQFCGPLHFASFEFFKTDMFKKVGIEMNQLLTLKEREKERRVRRLSRPAGANEEMVDISTWKHLIEKCRILIIDCSMLSYIDTSGVGRLKRLREDIHSVGMELFLASCAPHVIDMLTRCHFFTEIEKNRTFITVHDAFLVASDHLEKKAVLSINDAENRTITGSETDHPNNLGNLSR
ncbi:prestin-like [Brevipalpus obovatus]|uniref:prestin-like n=1 Tax=Brevipalpus obovatus TaxID=246614 RepID=UPI003D9E09B5